MSFRSHSILFLVGITMLAGCSIANRPQTGPEHVATPAEGSGQSFWGHRFNITKNIQYGAMPKQTLDIYQQGRWEGPPKYFVPTNKAKPTLIYIHGGAWHGGAKEGSLWSLIPYLQRGWQVVNIEYRSGVNTAPNAADDVLLAMQWIADHAEAYAIDRDNVVVSGDSAGGHLSLLAGMRSAGVKRDALKIKAVVNFFGISDIKALSAYLHHNGLYDYAMKWAGSDEMFRRLVRDYSPIQLIDQDSPAVLSLHGTADKVVPITQSIALHKRLDEFGIDNKLVRIENGRHLGFSDQQFQRMYEEVFAFLDRHTTN